LAQGRLSGSGAFGESFREYSARLVAHEKGEHEGGRKGSRISPRERIRRAAAALRSLMRTVANQKRSEKTLLIVQVPVDRREPKSARRVPI
jgi:hypothetical protein